VILIQSWQLASKNAHTIRKQVFIEEQGVPQELELDILKILLCTSLLKIMMKKKSEKKMSIFRQQV
jgi:RNA-binding protein YhbY